MISCHPTLNDLTPTHLPLFGFSRNLDADSQRAGRDVRRGAAGALRRLLQIHTAADRRPEAEGGGDGVGGGGGGQGGRRGRC